MTKTECVNKEKNLENCPCSYPNCDKKGVCCECIRYHLSRNELPACCFSAEIEKAWDRSFERFCKQFNRRNIQ
ncbi:cytosolic protein [Candidatus Woesearchaeota archaeon]|nr:cytosolic protein [Candidatus Woesearchaeota archaeon]